MGDKLSYTEVKTVISGITPPHGGTNDLVLKKPEHMLRITPPHRGQTVKMNVKFKHFQGITSPHGEQTYTLTPKHHFYRNNSPVWGINYFRRCTIIYWWRITPRVGTNVYFGVLRNLVEE